MGRSAAVALSIPEAYLPQGSRPWRVTMGLRPLEPQRWLEVDDRRREELAAKATLLASCPERVVATRPGSEAAGAELLDAVAAHLSEDHGVVEAVGGGWRERATGEVVAAGGAHPLDAAARMTQEDLCLMERHDTGWLLTAASVCFPSRWSLADKIGRDLRGIHAPVPGYEGIAGPTDAAFDRMRSERPLWRLNWTLIDSPDLHQPDGASRRRGGVVDDPGSHLWVRVERQTLRRLTARPAVTFTIRTYIERLDMAVAAHPASAVALHAALASAPPETVAYKGWAAAVAPVLDWLAERIT